MKIALNLDLTVPDDGECRALLISYGIIDLGAFCVELLSFFIIYFVLRVDSWVGFPLVAKINENGTCES